MGKAVDIAVGAIGATVAALAISSSLGVVLAVGLATSAMSYIARELAPDVAGNVAGNQELTVGKPTARVVVGETVISGTIIKYEKGKKGKQDWHFFYLALVPHKCESVVLYQLDGNQVSDMSGDGYYLHARLGDQTGPVARSLTYMSRLDASFIGTNATDVYCEFIIDQDVWPNGVQDVKFLVRGVRVYDPRKDDTAGGSGNHRINDESTWEWSDNAALINFWWKFFKNPDEPPIEMFSLANIAAEANLCDEQLNVTDSLGNTSSEKRYTCNGVFELSSGYEAVESQLLTSCGGRWIESTGGKYELQVAAYRGPAMFTITENHLAAAPDREPHTSLSDKFNIVNGTFVDKNAYYQDADITPIVSQNLIDNRDRGVEYESDMPLLFTQTESMSQRLGVIRLLRNAAGDTIKLVLKRCYANIYAGRVVYINLPNHVIVGNYEVMTSELDHDTGKLTLGVVETSADMFNQAQTPPDYDATPNFQIDNTYVEPVDTLAYTPTPQSSFRQGVLTWDHPALDAKVRFVVTIQQGSTVISNSEVLETYFNIVNLPVGAYTALVYAVNTFGKTSEAISRTFSTEIPSTPTGHVNIQVLPGRVIITGPALPNSSSTYEWKFYFSDSFENAFEGGLNKVLTVTNTPSNGTLYVWYRIVDGDLVDPAWVAFAVPNLVGISADEVTPELIGGLTLPGLPQTLLDTIAGVTQDLNQWSTQTGQLGGDYSTLLYNVTQATGAAAANSLEIIAVKELVGTTSVTAQITEFKNAQIGYEDPNSGDWIPGAAFAQAFDEVRITDASENELSIYQYFEALETRTGLLEGKVQLGIAVEGSFTGIEILAGSSGLSSFRLFMDELIFASRSGNIAYQYNAASDRHLWYGATAHIGATKMEIRDYENPFGPDNLVVWKGPTILNMGIPDFDLLTKANAEMWIDENGDKFEGGNLTISGVLKASAMRPGSGVMVSDAGKTGPLVVMSLANSNTMVRANRTVTSNTFIGPAYEVSPGVPYDDYRLVNYKTNLWLRFVINKHAENNQQVNILLEARYQMEDAVTYASIHNTWVTVLNKTVDSDYDYALIYLPHVYTTRDEPWQQLELRLTVSASNDGGKPLSISLEIQAFNNLPSGRTANTITGDTYDAPPNTQPPPGDIYEPPPGAILP